MVLLGLLGDVHKGNFTWNLEVIVEHRELSIGDPILEIVTFSDLAAFIRQTTPNVENSLNPPKIYESNFLVMNKRATLPGI